jgi:hypothetical protein
VNLESIIGDIINSMEQNTEQDWGQRAKQGEPAVKIVCFEAVIMIIVHYGAFFRRLCGQGAKFISGFIKKM